jgi:hypothetical protein
MSRINVLIFKLVTEVQERMLLTAMESRWLNATAAAGIQHNKIHIFYISMDYHVRISKHGTVIHSNSISVESVISGNRIADLLRGVTGYGLEDEWSILGKGKLFLSSQLNPNNDNSFWEYTVSLILLNCLPTSLYETNHFKKDMRNFLNIIFSNIRVMQITEPVKKQIVLF